MPREQKVHEAPPCRRVRSEGTATWSGSNCRAFEVSDSRPMAGGYASGVKSECLKEQQVYILSLAEQGWKAGVHTLENLLRAMSDNTIPELPSKKVPYGTCTVPFEARWNT